MKEETGCLVIRDTATGELDVARLGWTVSFEYCMGEDMLGGTRK